MNINCFTFSPLSGVVPGIKLEIGKEKIGGGIHPPHVSFGERFIAVDSTKKPVWRGEHLVSARIRRIEPTAGGKSFDVLSRTTEDCRSILVVVDLKAVPAGVKRKLDPEVINAWVYFETEANLVMRDQVGGRALIEFWQSGQSATIFDADGSVHVIARQGDVIMTQPLTIVEQAKERVRLSRQLITKYREDVSEGNPEAKISRLHGILGGVGRLLQVVIRHHQGAADIFINFLAEFVGPEMPVGLRKDLESLLRSRGHPLAVMFKDGDYGNVIHLTALRDKFKTGASKGAPAAERQRKQQRAERDRAALDAKRGISDGNKNRQRGKQK